MTDVAYSPESVTQLINTANKSYRILIERLDSLDYNLLSDMQQLYDKQLDTIDSVTKLVDVLLENNKRTRTVSTRTVVIATGVVFVGGFIVGVNMTNNQKKRMKRNG